jgi:peptide/nickel transport system substrate-binding protein
VVLGAGMGAFALACGGGSDDSQSGETRPAGTGATDASAVRTGGSLDVVSSEPADLNPHTGVSGFEHVYLWMIHDNLVAYDQQANPDKTRSLAESWEVVGNTQINFRLRDGVTFHDGEPFNAEAVKYNVQLVQDPATKSVARGQLSGIESVETPDPRTVVFKLKSPDAALLSILGDRGGMIVSPKAMQSQRLEGYALKPAGGTGPFKFSEWVKNDHFTVAKNPSHWRADGSGTRLPYVDRVNVRFLTEAAVQVAALETGQVAITPVNEQDLDRLKGQRRFTISEFKGTSVNWGKFNAEKAPTNDARFRQAIAYAIDRKTLTDGLTNGLSPVALGPITPAQWAFNPNIKVPGFDLQKAKQLMSASGVAPGTKLRAVTLTTDTHRRNIELWQRMLRQIDVDLETDFLEVGARTTKWREGIYNMSFTGFSIRADPHGSVYEQFHKGAGFAEFIPAAPDVDELLTKANQVYDQAERKKLYNQAEELIAEKYAMNVFTYYTVAYAGLSDKIGNADKVFGGEGKSRYNELFLKG